MTFPSYRDYCKSGAQWFDVVPSHWRVVALKRLVTMQSGEAITADAIDESGAFPVYGGNGIRGFSERYTHSGLHVLIGRQGALCGNINYADGKFWASEHAIVVTPREPTSTTWLGELLRAMDLNRYSVSAAQPGLSVDAIGRLLIPIPSQPEQTAIGEFLGRETAKIDALVAEQQRLVELLKEKRQAVISHAVTKGLKPDAPMKPSGVEWLGDVPAHWAVMPIRKSAKLESGHTPSRSHPEYWKDCTVPWFTLADIWQVREAGADYIQETKEMVSEIGLANSSARVLPKGTVMLSRTASVGFSAIMGVDMATTQDFANWICGHRLLPEFLLQVLRSMRAEFDRMKMGSTHNTIYMPDIQGLRFALPPKQEQEIIVKFIAQEVARIDALTAEAERAITLLQERRTALISAAVTGQIDVRGLAAAEVA